jgi:hypothetical protein
MPLTPPTHPKTTAARVNGKPGGPITGVTLKTAFPPGSSTSATSPQRANLTNLYDNGPVSIIS